MKLNLYGQVVIYSLLTNVLCQISSLPQVDLGYEIHQAGSYNETSQSYRFDNIRFAQAPVGDLRFAAPVAPTGRNPEVQTGNFTVRCPIAVPSWSPIGSEFAASFYEGNATNFNYTQAVAQLQAQSGNVSLSEFILPGTSEDCLFLDVVVPKSVFDGANNMRRKRSGKGAAVLVWIFGGGYVLGSKYEDGSYPTNPAGIITESEQDGSEGIIYVAMNYRLGAMGWLAGPTLQEAGGVSNAGLYDQRLALEWVKEYIHLFGGDPCRVTIMGQSAGGGSIMHQITAYAGLKPVPFQQAIPLSPGWFPITSTLTQENTTQTFLANLNVTSIAEARGKSSQEVIIANLLTVAPSPYGEYTFGPVVDGIFVTTQPGLAFLNGGFAKNVSVYASHVTYEAPYFTPPYVRTDDQVKAWFLSRFPNAEQSIADYIVDTLYPAVYNGTYPWRNEVERIVTLITEVIFSCNTDYLARAYDNQTYNFEFQVPPAQHATDVPSYFYDGQGLNLSLSLVPGVASIMQGYVNNFIQTGDPNGAGLPYFPMQGSNATEVAANITVTSSGIQPDFRAQRDPTANERCYWWQKGYYL